MIQKDINTFLVTKLNLNTQSILFKSGYIFWLDSGKLVQNSTVGYKIVETDFVPMMIGDWNNTSYPYENIDMQDIVVPMSFAIPMSKKTEALTAIEEFKALLQGTQQTVGSYTVSFRIGEPTPPSNPIAHKGEHWIIIDVMVMMGASIGLEYGNATAFKIAKTGETLVEQVYQNIVISTKNTVSPSTTGKVTDNLMEKSLQSVQVTIFKQGTIGTTLESEMWQSEFNEYDISVGTKTATMIIDTIGETILPGAVRAFTIIFVKAK